ncbi:MAG TPA: cation:proton antiporter [Luteimonas sp.]|nr:cation:proton antiporter [Luteimonas sp.]
MTLLLLVQLLVILVVARLCGWVLKHVGQPPVIGEMTAGIVLGPIMLGAWAPALHASLFPPASLPPLSALATLGLVLFMFVVGAELRAVEGTRAQVRAAASVGILGIALPLGLGLAISPWLYPAFAPDGVAFWPFALFMAAAMSVTAFPVLARILKDRDLTDTRPGRLALSAAVIDDGFVWVFLALVLTLTGGSGDQGIARTAIGAVVMVAVIFGLLKPLYARVLARTREPDGRLTSSALMWMLAGLLACAAAAEWIGLHAVFGAFLFGVCLPRDESLKAHLERAFEPVAVLLLMPILFALAGLNTTPEVFGGLGPWAFALILLVAITGKVAGGALGARLSGYGWRESLAVGALVNTRGLMELVVLKIGLDAGLIGPALFTMMLGMTVVTTVMTSPLLTLVCGRAGTPTGRAAGAAGRS